MELLNKLTEQLGISNEQARGGTGLLFKFAKDQLSNDDYQAVAGEVPEIGELAKDAPETGGLAGVLGGLASSFGAEKLGGLASVVGGFDKLGLDQEMVGKFVSVVLSYVESRGGSQVKGLLEKVLK